MTANNSSSRIAASSLRIACEFRQESNRSLMRFYALVWRRHRGGIDRAERAKRSWLMSASGK